MLIRFGTLCGVEVGAAMSVRDLASTERSYRYVSTSDLGRGARWGLGPWIAFDGNPSATVGKPN